MLPDCNVEGFTSFQMSPHEGSIYFNNPQEAKAQLKKENLNYFFFSNILDIRDPLAVSPLFSPEHIADHLGIAWTDGENTLLTWKEQASRPIDANWLMHYTDRNRDAKSKIRYDELKKVFSFDHAQERNQYLRSLDFRINK